MPTSTSSSQKMRHPGSRRLLAGLGFLLLAGPWSCFAAPVRELWPPAENSPRHRIDVVYRDWHTIIVVPSSPAAGPGRGSGTTYTEWSFCEVAWYLRGRQGCTGVCRALGWPTASGVEHRTSRLPVWRRYPATTDEHWTFVLSDAGLKNMTSYLASQCGAPLPGATGWCRGKRTYHLFFLCHHFTLRALREAGLPVRPWWGFTGWMTKHQLDSVRRFHEEARLVTTDRTGTEAR